MPESRLKHADNEDHRADGIALSVEQYRGFAAGFARPEAIYWDRQKDNALYVLPDDDPEWCILLPLNMPSKEKSAVKKLGSFDGIVTAYRGLRTVLYSKSLEVIFQGKK